MTDKENDKDPISKALGITPIDVTPNSRAVNDIINTSFDDSAISDFDMARANIIKVIEETDEALFQLFQLSVQSQNPRAWEVYAKLTDTKVQANKQLLDLQEQIRNIKGVDAPVGSQAKTINNNMFVGSTSELARIVSEMNKND